MKRIKQISITFVIASILGSTYPCALAQDEEELRRAEAERQRQEQEQQKQEREQEESIRRAREEFVNASRASATRAVNVPPKTPSALDRDFVAAVPDFRDAVTRYRDAMGTEQPFKNAIKDLNRFVDRFKVYFKQTHIDAMPLDKTEFKDFSRKDLIWETLTSAERIDGNLRLAAIQIQAATKTNTLSLESMVLMRDLATDLQRLEFLLSKLN